LIATLCKSGILKNEVFFGERSACKSLAELIHLLDGILAFQELCKALSLG